MKQVCVALAVVMVAVIAVNSEAKTTATDKIEQDVKQKFAQFETVLNQKEDHKKVVEFLHNAIKPDAQFELKVNNPTMPEALKGHVMEMDKAEYINTYINGAWSIHNYSVEIQPLDIQVEDKGDKVITKEKMVERGQVKDPQNPSSAPQEFVSTTICRSEHAYQDDKLVLSGSRCETEVSLEEAI